MSAGVVRGEPADMRTTAATLDGAAGNLVDIARHVGGAALDGALLGTLPFSPGSAAAAERELVQAAIAPGKIAAQAKVLAIFLRAKAELLEIADSGLFRTLGDYYGGIWEGLKGWGDTIVLLGKLSNVRMLVDPAGWARDMAEFGEGLGWAVTHPVEFGKLAIDWETWKTNPVRAFGKLVPDIALAIATWGTGTAASASARAAEAARVAERSAKAAEEAAKATKRLPDPATWPKVIKHTTPRGRTFDIPQGWVARTADNGKGVVYQRPGATGNADMIRIMDPTPQHPNGYFRYYNEHGQPLDVHGKPGPNSTTHHDETYTGPLEGWPK